MDEWGRRLGIFGCWGLSNLWGGSPWTSLVLVSVPQQSCSDGSIFQTDPSLS